MKRWELERYIETLKSQTRSYERLRDGYKTKSAKANMQYMIDENNQLIAWLTELAELKKKGN